MFISNNPDVVLLDVRTKDEFDGKGKPHFPSLKNAINIPVQELETRIEELAQYKNKTVLVYCSHSHRSPRASHMLTQSGFTKVFNMEGGMSVVTDRSCTN
jgi:rhodanese-related sulfurtransferase